MKKLTSSLVIISLAICSSMFALAQPILLAKTVVIPDGTEISAVTTEILTSKTATEGDPITFKVDEDLIIDGVIVVAKGTIVKGEVSNATQSGHFGKGGKLTVRVNSTETVDKQKLKLRASKGTAGNDKTGTTIALVLLVSPFFLLKKGKNAEIKAGTKIKVYTDEAKTVTVPTP